jgi:cobalt-zinc-cadmium efflux system membrane fusion protein
MAFLRKQVIVALTAVAAFAAAIALLRHATRAAPPAAQTPATQTPVTQVRPAGATGTPATLDLLPAQLGALRIEQAQTRSFPVEKQAVGSISFEEDPAIVQAESTLLGAAATLELTGKELRRVRGLGESNGIAQKELEQAIASEETARAALKAARDALRALGKSDVEINQLIARGAIATDASAGHHKWALANVAESDSVSVRPGQPVSLRVMACPGRNFQGNVSRVYSTVDPLTHRVAVRTDIADPHGELLAGMLAEFTIRVSEALPSPAIPANGAVREADGTTSVWVTADRHHFVQRTVRTGERNAGWVQILDGIQPGELVVTEGAIFLSNLLQAPPGD